MKVVRSGIIFGAGLAVALLAGCSSSDSGSEASAAASEAVASASAMASDVASEAASAAESAMESVSAAVSSAAADAGMVGPIVVEPSETEVAATVGRMLDFNVGPNPGDWTISSDNEAVVGDLTQGGEKDGAMFNPGAKALSPGTATVTLANEKGLEALVIKVTVTE